jgi:hypothetical protein
MASFVVKSVLMQEIKVILKVKIKITILRISCTRLQFYYRATAICFNAVRPERIVNLFQSCVRAAVFVWAAVQQKYFTHIVFYNIYFFPVRQVKSIRPQSDNTVAVFLIINYYIGMLCRKVCTFFSLVFASVSMLGYTCAYSVYSAQNNAVIFQTAAEHTGAVLAVSGMAAPKPECAEINTAGQKQAVPLRSEGRMHFQVSAVPSGCIFRYSQHFSCLLLPDYYTRFENKYRDTILTLQTLI